MDDAVPHPPSAARSHIPGLLRAVAWMGLGAAITVVLLAGAAMLALPALEQRPDLAARWMAHYLQREVHLEAMDIGWRDNAPLLRLRGLRVGSGSTGNLALAAAEVRVDTLGSLRTASLMPAAITVRGADIQVERAADGTLTVAGLGAARRAGPLSGPQTNPQTTDRVDAGRLMGAALAALPPAVQLRLEDAAVTVNGLASAGGALVLRPVTLSLGRLGDQLRLAGSVTATRAPEHPARFTLRWPAAAADPMAGAELTVNARSLPLAALPEELGGGSVGGELSLELDGTIVGGRLRHLRGNLDLANPTLAAAPGALSHLTGIGALVDLGPDADGWTMDLLQLTPRSAGRTWPPSTAAVSRRGDGGETRYEVRLQSAPLASVLPLLEALPLASGAARRLLASVTEDGRLEDVQVTLDPARHTARLDTATLRELRLEDPQGHFIAGPVNATLTLDADAGRVDLRPSTLVLHPGEGEQPLRLAGGGDLQWFRSGGVLRVATSGLNLADGNSRLRISGSVGLPAEPGQAMDLALEARSGVLEVETAKRYLPLLPDLPELREWLRWALHGGTVFDLVASANGALASTADLASALRVTAAFRDTSLRYLEGWPTLDGLRGTLAVDGLAFGFELEDGRVSGARIVSTSGRVADVTAQRPILDVRGRAAGATRDGSAFLSATPMAPRFTELLKQLTADGSARVDLEMRIPLYNAPPDVRGTLALSNNVLQVPALRSALTGVSGSIGFDGGGLGKGTLEAQYLDRRIKARIDGTLDQHALTRLSIEGSTDPRGLLRHLYDVGAVDSDDADALPMLSRLDGRTTWQVVMDIPREQDIGRHGIALTVTSNLAGMALELPAPLGKRRDERRLLVVSTRLALAGNRVFRLRYGERIRALLQVAGDDEGKAFRFNRGELRFGGEAAVLPDSAGLRVAGTLETLSVDDWVAFIAQAGAAREQTGAPRAMESVHALDVHARRLDVLGAGFDQVQITVTPQGNRAWTVAVRGDDLDGTIHIPVPVGSAAIDASFEHLHVRRESSARPRFADGALAPGDLPPARLVARRLRYNDVDLGLAKLTLRPDGDGLVMEELVAIQEGFEVRGTGRWSQGPEGTASQVDLRIHSSDFGRLTSAFGYGDSGVDGGVAEISLRAGWQGSPFDLALDRVTGELHFRASAGRLRDVQQGTSGRVFGLLNVTVLPRRLLRLDFSDLFQEGVGYERLEGSFRLADGNAFTDNVLMETENARVDITGRVGLVAEDYDQTMTVTPKLSASLPLAPLWLAEKFFKRKLIDSAFAYRYYITGTWSDPIIEREAVEAVPSEVG